MRRVRVIEEPSHRMGGEIYYREEKFAYDPELLEAYKCGKKDGWREAMREAEEYHERRMYDRDGFIKYRNDEEDWDDDDYMERRRHSRRTGRYI